MVTQSGNTNVICKFVNHNLTVSPQLLASEECFTLLQLAAFTGLSCRLKSFKHLFSHASVKLRIYGGLEDDNFSLSRT